MEKANLYEADLSGANLEQANLLRADLRGTNLTNVNLDKTNLTGAIYGKIIASEKEKKQIDTIFPQGFNPIKAGMILIE